MKNIFYIALICCIAFSPCCKEQVAQKPADTGKEEDTASRQLPVYTGEVLYMAEATADNMDNVHLFYQFSPARIDIYFQNNQFRLIEYGGLSKGNILVDANAQKAWHIDTLNKIVYEGVYSDFDNASETPQAIKK